MPPIVLVQRKSRALAMQLRMVVRILRVDALIFGCVGSISMTFWRLGAPLGPLPGKLASATGSAGKLASSGVVN